jgi:hypothetical protein
MGNIRRKDGGPFGVEEKEFLLTPDWQSVMNIFTASGYGCNFPFEPCEHRREAQK